MQAESAHRSRWQHGVDLYFLSASLTYTMFTLRTVAIHERLPYSRRTLGERESGTSCGYLAGRSGHDHVPGADGLRGRAIRAAMRHLLAGNRGGDRAAEWAREPGGVLGGDAGSARRGALEPGLQGR